MTNKDRDAIGKLYLEALDKSLAYDWDNPYHADLKQLKQHETDVDVDSERVVGRDGEWSADPEDYPNQYPNTEHGVVDLYKHPTMLIIANKLQSDKEFAFSPTKLGDMDPVSEWSHEDIIEFISQYANIPNEWFENIPKFKKDIYNAAKQYFTKHINYISPKDRRHRMHRTQSLRKTTKKRFPKYFEF